MFVWRCVVRSLLNFHSGVCSRVVNSGIVTLQSLLSDMFDTVSTCAPKTPHSRETGSLSLSLAPHCEAPPQRELADRIQASSGSSHSLPGPRKVRSLSGADRLARWPSDRVLSADAASAQAPLPCLSYPAPIGGGQLQTSGAFARLPTPGLNLG